MKKVELMMVEEPTPGIPAGEQRFVDLGELEDRIQIRAYDGGVGVPYLWRVRSKDFGVCYGETNPLAAITLGYFQVRVPQADGKPFVGYCTNRRIIATLRAVLDGKKEGKNPLTGEFALLDDAGAQKVYEERKIPMFTLI